MSGTIKPDPFYDRVRELAALDRAWKRHRSGGQMLLLYGRRRLGKTFLLQRYFAAEPREDEPEKPHCYFLAEQSTAATQRLTLARQLVAALPVEGVAADEIAVSWNALLRYASQHARARGKGSGRFALILDEFPYLVAQTPELPSILQAWWDLEGVHSPLFVVLCGSQLSAMVALGQESAPLFGRFNAGIFHMDPLHYEDVACFYEGSPHYGAKEKLLMYGVFGGTPRYHALVDPSRPPAEEIITLLMQPRAILENEVRFLLGSEQIRHPAPYNAILEAIAGGETKFNGIQQLIGVERGALSSSLRTLLDLSWIRRELPFGEHSERRAIYRVADPFLTFWYRFVAPLASDLQFSDPAAVYAAHVAPRLADYMGWSVFEEICGQWLQRHAKQRLGLTVRHMARYWSRDGPIEIDLIAELDNGTFLFGECKWRTDSLTRLNDLSALQAKVASLPEARWRNNPSYILFALGGFSPELLRLAADPAERLSLIGEADILPQQPLKPAAKA
ncbi:MAG TPA: ATP-binding protein [Acidobacteriaceae bacterium]|nr:ATP-binding protein [Acidobacteriaceae bacterium]